jgi:hypothetical protein
MLLGRADRDHDAGLALEIVVDELPSLELKLHEAELLWDLPQDASLRAG